MKISDNFHLSTNEIVSDEKAQLIFFIKLTTLWASFLFDLDSNAVELLSSVILVVLLSSSPITLTKAMGLFGPPGQNPSIFVSGLVLLFTDSSVSSSFL